MNPESFKLKFAAIDIGSNAVRLLIEEVHLAGNSFHVEKVSFTRVPIRLGADVFETKMIGEEKQAQLIKAMKAFWYLMDVHSIEHFRTCATSAMREAENSSDVIAQVKQEANIDIELIEGTEEAELIFSNFFAQDIDPEGDYLYIDVGGGSTEVSLIKNGVRIKSRSFPIGTVRILKNKVSKKRWVEARKWIQDLVQKENDLVAIGTGGNINKIFKFSGKKPQETISKDEIQEIHSYIGSYRYEERITKLRLKPDRADVIIPAAEIYHNFMEFACITNMMVPKVGLSDGIVLQLFRKWQRESQPND